MARPSRLDNPFVFHSVVRDQLIAKIHRFFETATFLLKKIESHPLPMWQPCECGYPNIQQFSEIFLLPSNQLISFVYFIIIFLDNVVIFAAVNKRKMETWHYDRRKAIAIRRKELRKLASPIIGKQLYNKAFSHSVIVTAHNIKEILNQPHKHYTEKNEAVLQIESLFESSKYLGKLDRKKGDHFSSFLFQTSIANDPSWFIVRKYDRGEEYCIYTISDQPNLLIHLEKKEDP